MPNRLLDQGFYEVPVLGSRVHGLYNGHALLLLLVSPLLPSLWLLLFFVLLLSMAVALDRERPSSSTVLSLSALSQQLSLYARVVVEILRETAFYWLGALLMYAAFSDVRAWMHENLAINFDHGTGHRLYAVYTVVRISFFLVSAFSSTVALDEKRKMLWALCLGQIGLLVRCYRLDGLLSVCGVFVPFHFHLGRSWTAVFAYAISTAFFSFLCLRAPAQGLGSDRLYYALHRTVHRVPGLWAFCHALHHHANKPSILDSGTIGPPELLLTETGGLNMAIFLWPYPVIFVHEIVSMVLHFVGHQHSIRLSAGQHHLLHHRRPDCNFGLHPELDKHYNTYREEAADPDAPERSSFYDIDFYRQTAK